ncbi:fish-egg lectin-like [Chaetodon trifascialis]|uniref:fish-egg lectin-like n=1 Tax=Chaetodon trifascialis TaxID=109706 RepID=UPI0039910CA4
MKAVAGVLLVLCYLAISQAWKCTDGPRLHNALQIDAGQGKVVAINKYYHVYFLTGKYWHYMGSSGFKHCSVGPAGLWAVSTKDKVFKWSAGYFRQYGDQSIRQVDAGGNGQVVGVDSSDYTYCLTSTMASAYSGVGSVSWQSLSRKMRYYSCSPYGCWGVDSSYQVYFTQGMNETTCATSGWILLPGLKMTMIEVGTDGTVFGVGTDGKIYQRIGIQSNWRLGTDWSVTGICMSARHVSYDLGNLWVVTTSGSILKCT